MITKGRSKPNKIVLEIAVAPKKFVNNNEKNITVKYFISLVQGDYDGHNLLINFFTINYCICFIYTIPFGSSCHK